MKAEEVEGIGREGKREGTVRLRFRIREYSVEDGITGLGLYGYRMVRHSMEGRTYTLTPLKDTRRWGEDNTAARLSLLTFTQWQVH